jgi:hypothetical protein
MRKSILALLVAAAPLTAAHAQTMTVADFLAKADALKAKGAMAMFSSDLGKLKKEMVDSAAQLREERLSAQKAGRKPAFCPPKAGKGSINSNEVLAHFQSIPPAQRSMTTQDGFAGLMRKKYPCPA